MVNEGRLVSRYDIWGFLWYEGESNAAATVRYTWADNPVCNLVNSEGLPAIPFRTDDWKRLITDISIK